MEIQIRYLNSWSFSAYYRQTEIQLTSMDPVGSHVINIFAIVNHANI